MAHPSPLIHIGKRPTGGSVVSEEADWIQANPKKIQRSLRHALGKNAGGWFVLGQSRGITERPRGFVVDGQDLLAYRSGAAVVVAPASCPHMGADLRCAEVRGGNLVCPWHGLELGPDKPSGQWKPFPSHDDGVLAWVRLPGEEEPTDAPVLAARPADFVDGVIRTEATCQPEDVIANRLDPWHGVHYHGHSFARLRVLEEGEERIVVRVSYRVLGPVCVEVDASFHCPNRRTIVMTILRGEGEGSVVETHATPLGPNRTAIIEATLATSERRGFQLLSGGVAPVLRGFIERRAARLWVEDAEYAERRFALRAGAPGPAGVTPLRLARDPHR